MVSRTSPARDHREPPSHTPMRASVNRQPDAEALTNLNFRVSEQFHREFKTFAAQHGMKMVEVLQESFALLKEKDAR